MLQQPSIACYDATNNASQLKIVYSPIVCVFNFTLVYGWAEESNPSRNTQFLFRKIRKYILQCTFLISLLLVECILGPKAHYMFFHYNTKNVRVYVR